MSGVYAGCAGIMHISPGSIVSLVLLRGPSARISSASSVCDLLVQIALDSRKISIIVLQSSCTSIPAFANVTA